MGRWGRMNEKSYRNCFKKFFDWFEYNYATVKQHCGKEIIGVFDPSYIKKKNLSCRKIKRIYNQCLNFGRIRA
jgi:hypothetical protein